MVSGGFVRFCGMEWNNEMQRSQGRTWKENINFDGDDQSAVGGNT